MLFVCAKTDNIYAKFPVCGVIHFFTADGNHKHSKLLLRMRIRMLGEKALPRTSGYHRQCDAVLRLPIKICPWVH